MERRDYLLTQIQQLARFIQLLIEKLTGKSSPLDLEQEMIHKKEEFKEKCGFDMELIATPHFDELKEALVNDKNYTSENIELLADYMVTLTERSLDAPPTLLQRIKQNALHLYEWVEVKEKTYSLDRQEKIAKVKMRF
jgi:hypothetical protein